MNSLINNREIYNENLQNFIQKNEEKILILKNSIISPNNNTLNSYNYNNYNCINKNEIKNQEKKNIKTSEISLDTSDLSSNIEFEANFLKKKFTNPLLSWKMLEKISDFNQWTMTCLGNLIENSLKKEINTNNIHIDIRYFLYDLNKKQEIKKLKTQIEENINEKDNLIKKYFPINPIVKNNINTNNNNTNTNSNSNSNINSNTNSNEKKFFNEISPEKIEEEIIEKEQNNYDKSINNHNNNNNQNNFNNFNNNNCNNKIKNKIKPVLIIKDDGKGISSENFNTIFSSIAKNEKKEFCFFKSGMSLKSSIIRLCKSFLIITKTENEINIGILSKNLQEKFSTDFIITPILNFNYDKFSLSHKSNTNFLWQILFFFMEEIFFIFENFENFFEYIKSFPQGTHIFLFDLNEVNICENFFGEKKLELNFDLKNADISNRHFDMQIGQTNFIESSFRIYLKFLFLQRNEDVNFFLLGKKVDLINPYLGIYNTCKDKNNNEILKLRHSLKLEKETNGVFIDSSYKGVLFNQKFLKKIQLESSYDNCIVNSTCVYNGVLLYCNNRLISRLDQMKFGEICFFLKKFEKMHKLKNTKNLENLKNNSSGDTDKDFDKDFEKDFHLNMFPINGFIELPKDTYEILNNKTVIYNFFIFFL
jgi:hypothetical protein